MARKAVGDRGKKSDIIAAAGRCFLENGYDGTSIRSIMKEAGAEVGLFYYYFSGKDEVFDAALELFYQDYREEFTRIVKLADIDPYRVLSKCFEAIHKMSIDFKSRYSEKLHRSVIWALREKVMQEVTVYIQQILEKLVARGAKIKIDVPIAARFMSYGVGSIVLYEGIDKSERAAAEMKKCIALIMGNDENSAGLVIPEFATAQDVAAIYEIQEECAAEGICAPLSKMDTDIHLKKKEILVVRYAGKTVGFISFDRAKKMRDVLAIKKEYRTEFENIVLNATMNAEFVLADMGQ